MPGGGPMGPGRGGPGGPGLLPMLGPQVNLTDTQKDQIKTIATSHRDEWKALMDKAMAARQALEAATTTGAADEALIRQRAGELGAVDADVAVARARAFDQVWALLTPDQQTQMQARPGPPPRGRR